MGAVDPPQVGDILRLRATGEFYDGTPFEVSDCITLIGDDWDKPHYNDPPNPGAGMGFPSPNPFNPVTRISYTVPTTQHVRIAIYDVAGRMVEDLVNETKSQGEYVVEWDAGRLPSGVYFFQLRLAGGVQRRNLVVVR